MKTSWHRAGGTLIDESHNPETLSVFWNYDLGNWLFGFRWEPDDGGCWYDLTINLGPVYLSYVWWTASLAKAAE